MKTIKSIVKCKCPNCGNKTKLIFDSKKDYRLSYRCDNCNKSYRWSMVFHYVLFFIFIMIDNHISYALNISDSIWTWILDIIVFFVVYSFLFFEVIYPLCANLKITKPIEIKDNEEKEN